MNVPTSSDDRARETRDAAYRVRFETDGYFVSTERLDATRLEGLRDLFVRLDAATAGRDHEFIAFPHVRPGGARILELASDPLVVDAVEAAIGPDIVFWGSTFFGKRGGSGTVVPWHQDGTSWPIEPVVAANLWLALDPSTPETGCVQCLPGSHRLGYVDVSSDDARPFPALPALPGVSETDRTDIVLEPGQFSVHHPALLHSSQANRSNRRRVGLALLFMSAASRYVRSDNGRTPAKFFDRPIWLVRGRDIAGNHPLAPGTSVAGSQS